MNSKLVAIAGLSAFAAFAAHAFQGEENPLPPQPFQPAQSRTAVQAQASAGADQHAGTGVLVTGSGVDRATVRAGAVAAARAGSAFYGERGTPM